LTAVATANGTVTHLFRNEGWWVLVAIVLVLIGVLTGYLVVIPGFDQRLHLPLLIVGVGAVVVGLGIGLVVEVFSLSLNDRPTISATTKDLGSIEQFDASVTTSDVKAHDQMTVVVYGLLPNGARGSTLYYNKSGPDTNGNLNQQVQLFVDRTSYGGVYVSALLIPADEPAVNVDCDGDIIGPDGSLTTTTLNGQSASVPFRPGGNAPLVGCLTLRFPPFSTTSSTPAPAKPTVSNPGMVGALTESARFP